MHKLVLVSVVCLLSSIASSQEELSPTIVVPAEGEDVTSTITYTPETSFSSFSTSIDFSSYNSGMYQGLNSIPVCTTCQGPADATVIDLNTESLDLSKLGPGKMALGSFLRNGTVIAATPLYSLKPVALVNGINNACVKIANSPGNAAVNKQAAARIREATEKLTKAAANGQISTANAYNSLQQLAQVADSFASNPGNFADGKLNVVFEPLPGGGYRPEIYGPAQLPPSGLVRTLDSIFPGLASSMDNFWIDPMGSTLDAVQTIAVASNLPPVTDVANFFAVSASSINLAAIKFLDRGANSKVYLMPNGEVLKDVMGGEPVAKAIADYTNSMASKFPGLVPPMTQQGNLLRQAFVDGYRLRDLDPALKTTALQNVGQVLANSSNVMGQQWIGRSLKLGEPMTQPSGLIVKIDVNPHNFRFNPDGTIKGWFDPIRVVVPAASQ